MKLIISPQARLDLREIVKNIAKDKPNAARKWRKGFSDKCTVLLVFPESGAAKFEIRENMRIIPFGNYVIFYRTQNEKCEIVRVLHGARDWQNIL